MLNFVICDDNVNILDRLEKLLENIFGIKYKIEIVEEISKEDIENISGDICNSVTISTLHGCPPQEIERIAMYLITEKGFHTFIKCNPTLLGYEFARKTMDDMGYDYVAFGDFHFKDDLQWEDAVPMLNRLMKQVQTLIRSTRLRLLPPSSMHPQTILCQAVRPVFIRAVLSHLQQEPPRLVLLLLRRPPIRHLTTAPILASRLHSEHSSAGCGYAHLADIRWCSSAGRATHS